MPVFRSALARRMSAVLRTEVIRSAFSVNQRFHRATLRIVSANPSQIEQVQFAAVNPPLYMSAKTARLHFEITSPSMTMSDYVIQSCRFLRSFEELNGPEFSCLDRCRTKVPIG